MLEFIAKNMVKQTRIVAKMRIGTWIMNGVKGPTRLDSEKL